jgi:cytochrome c-type biogenesis protein
MIVAVLTALWIGILTSISPCPLATNVAAVSYLSKNLKSPWSALASGIFYTLGRSLTYVVVGSVVIAGVLAIPDVSFFLQRYMNRFLGPVLVLVGMFLTDLLRLPSRGGQFFHRATHKAASAGYAGAFVLGILFGLSLCPVSAALFFGVLIPLAIEQHSSVVVPAVFGIGTGLPVMVLAAIVAFGIGRIGAIASHISKVEVIARRSTGVLFILVGLYFIARYIFELW